MFNRRCVLLITPQCSSLQWHYLDVTGIFLAILGRGPRAFVIGKISDVNPKLGKFSEYSKLIILSKLTYLIKLMHLEYLIIA